MRRKLPQIALGAMLVAALAACATGGGGASADDPHDEGDLIERAQAEGQVVFYTGWRDSMIQAAQEAFEARYGVELVVEERLSSSALGQRIDADIRATGGIDADVVMASDLALASYIHDEGYTAPVAVEDFPHLDRAFLQGDTAVTCHVGVPVVGYNTDVVGEIETWDDLLDPSLNGRIMVNDPRGSAAWANTWSAIFNSPQLGEDYLAAIGDTAFQPVASSLVGTEQLVAGQGDVLLFGTTSLFEPAMDAGESINYWFPSDPAPVFFNFCQKVEDSAHPAAAQLFFEWLLSEEAQLLAGEHEQHASPLGDIGGPVPLPENFDPAPAPYKVAQDMPTMLELLGFN